MSGPRPVLYNQHNATLPDGSPDPDALTDCGETCCVSEIASWRGLRLRIGAVREAMGIEGPNGSSGPQQFVPLLEAFRLRVKVENLPSRRAAGTLRRRLRGRRRHALSLGYFQGREELHWVVGYGVHPKGIWVMDPWVGEYLAWDWGSFLSASVGVYVFVRG